MKSIKTALKVFLLSFKVDFINSLIVLLISIILGLLPYLNTKGMLIIANLSNNSNLGLIILGIIFIVISAVGIKLISSLKNIFINKLSNQLEFRLKKDLKEKIVKIDYRTREQNKFQQELRLAYNALNPFGIVKMNSFIPLLISNMITIISLSIILIQCDIFIWIFIIVLTCITIILRNVVIKKNIADERSIIDDRMLEETMLGNVTNAESYAELRLNNAVDWATEKWEEQQKRLFKKELKINNKFQAKSESINFIAHNLITITALLILILMNKADVASVVMIFTAIQNLVNNLYIFSSEMSITTNFLENFKHYNTILDKKDCLLSHKTEIKINEKVFMHFKDVSFKYNDKYALEKINFDIFAGEKIAIVGYNGSGKTTLLKLLLGIYSPYEGNIVYYGCNEDERPMVSVVWQDFARYKFSLRENITLYNPKLDFDDDKINEILEKYKLNDLLVYGSNVILANEFGGINLSTGQWQKLSLIRSRLKDAYDIYIMDEATSALDSYTESEIINEILNESKTLVYVCHRLICVKSFDKIIFMDSGKIAGIGSHDELFETNQEYKELYLSQAKEYLN